MLERMPDAPELADFPELAEVAVDPAAAFVPEAEVALPEEPELPPEDPELPVPKIVERMLEAEFPLADFAAGCAAAVPPVAVTAVFAAAGTAAAVAVVVAGFAAAGATAAAGAGAIAGLAGLIGGLGWTTLTITTFAGGVAAAGVVVVEVAVVWGARAEISAGQAITERSRINRVALWDMPFTSVCEDIFDDETLNCSAAPSTAFRRSSGQEIYAERPNESKQKCRESDPRESRPKATELE
jgi:hypothetical protein